MDMRTTSSDTVKIKKIKTGIALNRFWRVLLCFTPCETLGHHPFSVDTSTIRSEGKLRLHVLTERSQMSLP